MISPFRRVNRIRTTILGLAAGFASTFVFYLVGIETVITNSNLVPYYAGPTLTFIFFPIIFGALVSLIYMVAVRGSLGSEEGFSLIMVIEGTMFGALGAVSWWAIPDFVFGLSYIWLTYALLLGMAIMGGVHVLSFSFWPGPYLGASIAGAVFCVCLALFSIGVFRELLGLSARMSRQYTRITMIIAGSFGALYGIIFAQYWLSTSFLD